MLAHYCPAIDPGRLSYRRYARLVSRLPDLIRFLAGKPIEKKSGSTSQSFLASAGVE